MTGRHVGALSPGLESIAYREARAGTPIRLRGRRHKPAADVRIRALRQAWWSSPEGRHANPHRQPEPVDVGPGPDLARTALHAALAREDS